MPEGEPKPVSSEEEKKEENFELTPEIERMVMEKVDDINRLGTGVHSLVGLGPFELRDPPISEFRKLISRIKKIITLGLVSPNERLSKHDLRTKMRERPPSDSVLRRYRFPGAIYFNVLGRSTDDLGSIKEKISYTRYSTGILVIFDTDKLLVKERRGEDIQHGDHRRLRTDEDNLGSSEVRNWEELPYVDESYGYLAHRVPPRFFKGLIMKIPYYLEEASLNDYPLLEEYRMLEFKGEISMDASDRERRDQLREQLKERGIIDNNGWWVRRGKKDPTLETYKKNVDYWLDSLVSSMKEGVGENTDRLLPVYDLDGNLLWPKQMSYEEVKKFVAERDVEKEKGNKEDDGKED